MERRKIYYNLLIFDLICVHEGGWYRRDPRNDMICTCRIVITAVIIDI